MLCIIWLKPLFVDFFPSLGTYAEASVPKEKRRQLKVHLFFGRRRRVKVATSESNS